MDLSILGLVRKGGGCHLRDYTDNLSQIKSSGSNVHGDLKTAMRTILPQAYGLIMDGKTKSIAQNKKRVQSLLTNYAFMYRDPVNCQGYAEASVVSLVLKEAWFQHANDCGNTFAEYFNPVGTSMLAFIFTTVGA
ncbi:hypothetical protein OF83DRAFT_1068229, partial [Amylostereum chailletii]